LILKFTERLSNREIGQIMGRTEGAIKSLYHRTLLALRDELEEEGFASFELLHSDNGDEPSPLTFLAHKEEGD